MSNITKTVLKFLFTFIFSKARPKDFIYKHKFFAILLVYNLVTSVLYIYMAEQTIVRTNQTRVQTVVMNKLKDDLLYSQKREASLRTQLDNTGYNILSNQKTIDIETINNEYTAWAKDINSVETSIDKIKPTHPKGSSK